MAGFLCAKPSQSFHVVSIERDDSVKSIQSVRQSDILINAGYFVFRNEIFNYIREGEELVVEPFQRLIADKNIVGYRSDQFWCMDTFKEHQELTDMYNLGNAPWEVWKSPQREDRGKRQVRCMMNLTFARQPDSSFRVLCLGAHSDDIEIGCGGTILRLLEENPAAEIYWVVLGATGPRKAEALESANIFLAGAKKREVVIKEFRDGYFPHVWAEIKDLFEELKKAFQPDLILTHYRGDLHQDHRLVSELTWNTFRNHLILEYEIFKYDGDLGTPNFFVQLAEPIVRKKIRTSWIASRARKTRAGLPRIRFRRS